MRFLSRVLPVLIVIIVGVFALMLYQVDTTEYAILTRFGQPLRAITQPGLNFKLPDPIESVQRIDNRLQVFDMPQTEFLTQDKKNVIVEAYATWQVTEPLLFLKSVRDSTGAEIQLADIIRSELGAALGQVDLDQLVTIDPPGSLIEATMVGVTQSTDQRAQLYGFAVTDVQLKLLTFPEAAQQSVFQRMRAEREAIARKFRSEGAEEAAKMRAQADTQASNILSEASRDAARLRGQADALAIRIYAQAYGQDPEFYKFLRTLESYETFVDEGTVMILPSDSELLQYLNPSALTPISPTTTTTLNPSLWLSPTVPITELLPMLGITSTDLIPPSVPAGAPGE